MWTANTRKIIRGAKEHIAAGLGIATDYVARYEPMKIWFDGLVLRRYKGSQGGNWLEIMDNEGIKWQFAHLSKYNVEVGEKVKAGDIVAITGNTGTITTGAHLHVQAFKNGLRINPESYFKIIQGDTKYMYTFEESVEIGHYLMLGRGATEQEKNRWFKEPHIKETITKMMYDLARIMTDKGIPTYRQHVLHAYSYYLIGRDLTGDELQKTISESAYLPKFTNGLIYALDRRRPEAEQKIVNK